jgi:hypothetical protein
MRVYGKKPQEGSTAIVNIQYIYQPTAFLLVYCFSIGSAVADLKHISKFNFVFLTYDGAAAALKQNSSIQFELSRELAPAYTSSFNVGLSSSEQILCEVSDHADLIALAPRE